MYIVCMYIVCMYYILIYPITQKINRNLVIQEN